MTVTKKANAKINLMLDVVGRRPDGYHDLVTVMQGISLSDTLHATRQAGEEITLSDNVGLPTDEENLVVRAANAYFKASGAPFGVSFVLEKYIPMQAGLGGGSADAAAALHALNTLDGDRFTPEQLCGIAATVGADVPFCVVGGTRECRGIGERMTPVASSLNCFAVVAMNGEGVSTPRAFADLDEKYGDFAACSTAAEQGLSALKKALAAGELAAVAPLLYNRFEEVIAAKRPAVGALKQSLLQHGALVAQMSGSGPAVFALFESKQAAEKACAALCATGVRAFTAALI